MNVCLVGDLKDSIEKNSAEFVSSFSLSLLGKYPHFDVSVFECGYFPDHLLFHLLEFFLLSPSGGLYIDFTAFFVASIAELSVVGNDVFALLGAPLLIVKLLFLFGLTFHTVEDLIRAPLSLHVLVGLHLIDDHLAATSFAIFPLLLADHFLILRSQTRGSQGHGGTVEIRGSCRDLYRGREGIVH